MSISCTKIEVKIGDERISNHLVDALADNENWYAEDGFVSYDFSGIYHAGDVFLIEKDAPVEFTVEETEDALGMCFDIPHKLADVVPFFRKLNDWYLKQRYEEEGTVVFDLMFSQLEELGDSASSISIVYEELETDGEEQCFRGEFTYAGGAESYSESLDPEDNSLRAKYFDYL